MTDTSLGRPVPLWRGAANSWECDELGHLNVRAYMAKATEALDVLASKIGTATRQDGVGGSVLALRSAHVRYLAEIHPGAGLAIDGGVCAMTDLGLEAALVMTRSADGAVAAGFRLRADHAAPRDNTPFRWSPAMAARAQALAVAAPEETHPRGLVDTESDAADADHREDCQATGAPRSMLSGLGVFQKHEADAFGWVRADALVGRVSDAASIVFAPASAALTAESLSAAVVELQLTMNQPVKAGAAFTITSRFQRAGPRLVRLDHIFAQRETSAPFAVCATLAVFFDLNVRMAVPPPASVAHALFPETAP